MSEQDIEQIFQVGCRFYVKEKGGIDAEGEAHRTNGMVLSIRDQRKQGKNPEYDRMGSHPATFRPTPTSTTLQRTLLWAK